MKEKDKPLIYLAGDIMTRGSNLARQYEYDTFLKMNLPVDVYSPVKNDSINKKSAMTEEENNHLAEKIVKADVDRLWNSDAVVACPEQHAIGTMCEVGILYGWTYMVNKLKELREESLANGKTTEEALRDVWQEIIKIGDKNNYYHYFDIRTNHLNEKDWRRSFSINQFLYGCILLSAKNGDFQEFEEIMENLKEKYGSEDEGGTN